jgi:hypothetical protein
MIFFAKFQAIQLDIPEKKAGLIEIIEIYIIHSPMGVVIRKKNDVKALLYEVVFLF